MIDKKWRPENWFAIKQELLKTPFVWGTAIPYVSHEEQIIEATASRIIDEFLKLAESEETKNGETNEVRDIWQTGEPEKSL